MLARFRFKEMNDRVLITNDFGYYMWITKEDFQKLCDGIVDPKNRPKFRKNFFLIDDINIRDALSALKNFATKYYGAPNTFILKFTNACNYNCCYCQAGSDHKNSDQMCSVETAYNAVNLMLQTPNPVVTFEIQGGEPTLNFDVVKKAVMYCEQNKGNKVINYRMMSNLSVLDEDMISFCRHYNIHIGSSIDGPKDVHDANRPSCNGCSSFDQTYDMFSKLRSDPTMGCGFITTVTKTSIDNVDSVVNFSLDTQHHYNTRPLFRLGKAIDNWDEIGYTAEEFIDYYKKAAMLCIQRYLDGDPEAVERNLLMRLRKIIQHENSDIENGSPCGAIQCMVSIDWNGDVVACEGSKMLREPHRSKFVIGNVNDENCSFEQLFFNNNTLQLVDKMFSVTDVKCANCVYLPYCGNCAVERESNEDFTTYNCKINEGCLDFIFELLEDPNYRPVLDDWLRKPFRC